jgi:fructokinase
VIVVIGEILIDMFKDYHRIGGAPFNFAFHLKHLGFPVRFLTRVGDDQNGRRIIGMLKECGFSEADIQIDSRFPTGTVHVDLDGDGVPQFDIIENVAYDHLDLDIGRIEDAGPTGMIYYGTLVQRTDSGFRQVQRFLDRQGSAATYFCDINMRPPHVNAHAVAGSLHFADLLKVNDAELAEIQRTFDGPSAAGDVMPWLMETFKISAVSLTRG